MPTDKEMEAAAKSLSYDCYDLEQSSETYKNRAHWRKIVKAALEAAEKVGSYGKENSAVYWKTRHALLKARSSKREEKLRETLELIKQQVERIRVLQSRIINMKKKEKDDA